MQSFLFCPDLFEARTEALEFLALYGMDWFTEFGGVDLAHDLYGLEVTGIHRESDAQFIHFLLIKKFPEWTHSRRFYDENPAESGWKVIISKHPEPSPDSFDSFE